MVLRLGAVRCFSIMDKLQDKMGDRNAEKQGVIMIEHDVHNSPLHLTQLPILSPLVVSQPRGFEGSSKLEKFSAEVRVTETLESSSNLFARVVGVQM